ncbi:unnamed protein product [Leptidea sinapis]|uniref:Uncharacterized protein n=1 Tax=Leptidea sinapis TaxID=189913 RepID=A0A5E4QJH2_9NEOP|nr:unnamed protein product [Leptidea sinapis]
MFFSIFLSARFAATSNLRVAVLLSLVKIFIFIHYKVLLFLWPGILTFYVNHLS